MGRILPRPHAEEHRSATRVQTLPLPNRAAMRTRVRVRRNFLACALLRMRTTIACGILHHVKQPISFPRPHFCVRALPLCFTHPHRGVGGAPRDVRVLGGTPVGVHVTRHARRLARRLASHDAGRSPHGAPPWRFWAARGRASLTEHPPPPKLRPASGSVTASSSQPGRSAWRAGPLPPGAAVTKPPPQDATPRSAFRMSPETPLKERGCESSSMGAICSQ
jgi:hypothetical protein